MRQLSRLALLAGLCALTACATFPRMESTRDPLSLTDHLALGDSYLANGDRESAARQYEMALKTDRNSLHALIALGNMAFENNDLNKARSYFRRALRENPENAAVINNFAMVDVSQNKHLDRAKLMLEKALPTAGKTAPYLLDTLATIAIQQGRYGDAKLALDQADAGVPVGDVIFHKHIQDTREKMNRLAVQVK